MSMSTCANHRPKCVQLNDNFKTFNMISQLAHSSKNYLLQFYFNPMQTQSYTVF